MQCADYSVAYGELRSPYAGGGCCNIQPLHCSFYCALYPNYTAFRQEVKGKRNDISGPRPRPPPETGGPIRAENATRRRKGGMKALLNAPAQPRSFRMTKNRSRTPTGAWERFERRNAGAPRAEPADASAAGSKRLEVCFICCNRRCPCRSSCRAGRRAPASSAADGDGISDRPFQTEGPP